MKADHQSPASTSALAATGDGTDRLPRATMGLRLHLRNSLPEERFEELLAMLARHRGIADELTFFTHSIHPVEPLESLAPRLEILAQRMARARQSGFRAGLNWLSTLGHIDEYLEHALKGDFTPMTGIDGSLARGSFCPNDERFQEYIRQAFTLAAKTNPDFIWTDDDVCMGGHRPARVPCFCHNCLRIFNQAHGAAFTRETLRDAFDSGPLEEKKKWRRAWIDHSGQQLHKVLALVEQTVHALKPGCPLGRMPTEQFYEGWLVEGDRDALAGPGKAPVKWRPSGHAHEPSRLIHGSYNLGRTVGYIPESEKDIQSEIENFPYQFLKKPVRSTVLQVGAHIAGGATGSLLNILTMFDEPLDEYEPLIHALAEARPFYDRMARALGRRRPKGFFGGWNRHSMIEDNLLAGRWPEGGFGKLFRTGVKELLEIGMPPAFRSEDAALTLLSEDSVLSFPKADLKRLLSGGVYMDGKALVRLNEMGLSALTGLCVDSWAEQNCAELLTDDPLNGGYAGRRRDIIQSFWPNPCAVLTPLDPAARILARKVERLGTVPSFNCMGAFENKLGGRVVVAGYAPWDNLLTLSKTTQMKSLFRWLSKDTLPGYVASFHTLGLWIRETDNGGLAVVVLNASEDVVENAEVALRTPALAGTFTNMRCQETKIAAAATGQDGPYTRFNLPRMAAWDFALVVCRELP
jgi:hypothetical protein